MSNERSNISKSSSQSSAADMGRHGGQKRGNKADARVQFKGFVNYEPTIGDKQPFAAYLSEPDNVSSHLATIVEQGHKLSISYDRRSDCFVASIYANSMALPHNGLCLTQRSADWYKAICKALYVHFEVFKTVWPDNGSVDWTDPLE